MPTRQYSSLVRRARELADGFGGDATDRHLLDRYIRRHEEEAFAALVTRYGGAVFAVCRRVLRDHHAAEDAFQATFLVLAQRAEDIRNRDAVGGWLYRVALRVSHEAQLRLARQHKSELPADQFSADAANPLADPRDLASSREVLALVDEELRKLPDRYLAPVLLCYLQGKTNCEAADQLGWPAGTVKGRLSRARDLLRERLARRGVVLSAGGLVASLIDLAGLAAAGSETPGAALFTAGHTVSPAATGLADSIIRGMIMSQFKRAAMAAVLLMGTVMGIGAAADHAFADAGPTKNAPLPPLVRSAGSGPWSAAETWENGRVPAEGDRVQVRAGHAVKYDVKADTVIRSIHVAGELVFARDRDTLLNVGLIKIQPGDDASENGFDCEAHGIAPKPGEPRPVLEVGTADDPIPARFTARIRLHLVPGLDKETCPAIVCCGGRLDLHGAPMARTWVKLGATAKAGDATLTLAEPAPGWRAGDRIIITATRFFRSGEKRIPRTGVGCASEKLIRDIDGAKVTLDAALEEEHLCDGEFRAEVANLSRNVLVESADPARGRGHTMYHKNSAGGLSYAEFRGLGKDSVLGKYPIHYHLCGQTMRGSSVIGVSVWDSGNRWVTVHGTDHLVVRDCVGYLGKGHGFFLEDGTEAYNLFDRNLAVQAYVTKPLPNQVLPFDKNEAAGFWWANCLNTFTRNVACGNERYGFRYEVTKTKAFDPVLPVRQPDGTSKRVDVRTLPFVRFEGNETHSNGTYGVNIGEGVDRIGPDARHPLVVRDTRIWRESYSFRPQSPSMLVENLRIDRCAYGIYHPNYDRHVYRNVYISNMTGETVNRGHDDYSVQYGSATFDGLTFDTCGQFRDGATAPMIQISDDNPTGKAETHVRNVKVLNYGKGNHRALVNRGFGNRPDPTSDAGVPVYLHDWFGLGRTAKVQSTAARDFKADGLAYREAQPVTGDESRVAEVKEVAFPKLLDPVDDLPPTTVITSAQRRGNEILVRGAAADNGLIARVRVNGVAARATSANFAEWEATVPATKGEVSAYAEDSAGNVEPKPHVIRLRAE